MSKLFLLFFLLFPFFVGAQLSNDVCDSAIVISQFDCISGNNYGGFDNISSCLGCQVPNCGQHKEVWYKFVATSPDFIYWVESTTIPNLEILVFHDDGGDCDDDLIHDDCGPSILTDTIYGLLTVGETYYIAISSDFDIEGEFNMCTGGALLPIELLYFGGYENEGINYIYWTTLTEINNDFFTLERSIDCITWSTIAIIDGAGNSNTPITYEYEDDTYVYTINYYRLKQTDYNGNYEVFGAIAINNRSGLGPELIKVINMLGQEVNVNKKGFKIFIYSDGSVKKIINQ